MKKRVIVVGALVALSGFAAEKNELPFKSFVEAPATNADSAKYGGRVEKDAAGRETLVIRAGEVKPTEFFDSMKPGPVPEDARLTDEEWAHILYRPCKKHGDPSEIKQTCADAETAEVDIDRLCPPRPETAAKFRAGAYPAAARPYREAAQKAFAYMTSLPAMRTLVETGKVDQNYQHNAYVAKTHAAHVCQMLAWARIEPAKRDEAMRFAKASAEYLLTQLEPADATLAFWPPTYIREPLCGDRAKSGAKGTAMVGSEPEGAVRYRGEVMLIYPANAGLAFLDYWRETRDGRFLQAAVGIGATYLRMRRPDGSWPLKMKLATGETVGENTLVPTVPLSFFNELFAATGEAKWRAASDRCFAWLEEHPLKDWNWDGQFEDVRPEKPYKNPTKHNAVEAMLEILRRFPGDPKRIAQCRRILKFCEDRFVCWERPENQPKWDVPSVLEQYSCFVPIDASATKMIRAYLALWRATKDSELLEKAKALGNTLTRVQLDSGRIPTFWTHDWLGDPVYDWLNCMGAGACALVELADAG